MEYYTPLTQNQQNLNLMQSMHYQQLIPPEIGQQPTAEPWEHDKHVSFFFFKLISVNVLDE